MTHKFDRTSCTCPKASVSDYAMTGNDVGTGSLLAALADAGFLIGLKRNRWQAVHRFFVNCNNRRWNPDAIVFNSSNHYGTPSYWVQKFFRESSGATLPDAKLQTNSSTLVASAINWQNSNLPEK
ncbi:PREDICTED: alpha-L-arabinofuranosidase 1-like [Populus euphratica]|uniref:Alpha-L-arabinofuranosidase 1-like n=1 Tax=Populus euphratica TaxID=75702 RepID=A0AAJ6V696_POPEU|nr:PREDICTED: alpha-L-arabinofuranosidase 1-like [Populus euphratica]